MKFDRIFPLSRLSIALAMFVSPGNMFAAQENPFSLFEEEAKVITASRRPQSIQESPVAVDVVTAEEIRVSGAVNLWDLLRFRMGMDVLDARSSVDANRAIVSVRGFPQVFAANIQVLLDGRSVYKASTDGTYWDELPVQMADIEKIEIIRGPNSALYGTGASLGVINIITKKPGGANSFSTDNRIGNLGFFQTSEAVESRVKKMSYRTSFTYRRQNGFPLESTDAEANDFLNKKVANLRAEMPLSRKTNLQLFAGGAWTNAGVPVAARPKNDFDDHFQMVKLSHEFSSRSTLEFSGSRSDSMSKVFPQFDGGNNDTRNYQYDVETLHRLDWAKSKMNTTYGISYRSAVVESFQHYPNDHRVDMELARVFASQTVKLGNKFSLQGALAWDHSNISHLKPSYQVAGLYRPAVEHTFRLSHSVAYTIPDAFPMFATLMTSPTVLLTGNPELPPYRVESYELGYHGNYLDHHLQADSSLFYTTVNNFHSPQFRSFTTPPPVVTLRFENHNNAIARGIESGVKYRFSPSRWVYANYTYEHISDEAGELGLRVENTPAHKLNVGGSVDIARGFSASTNLGYKDGYFITVENGPSRSVRAYWRLDGRLAYCPPHYRHVEVFVAGQNLTRRRHVESADGLAVPRTYQAGFTVKF